MYKYIINEEYKGMRLDKVLTFILSNKSRTYTSKMIEDNLVLVNDKKEKASYKVELNDVISYELIKEEELSIKKEDIPLKIIYEDKDVIIINKPQGMVTHPAPGNYEHTLVNAILNYTNDLSGINGVIRPGIVHRLDKDTSGLICVAKNDIAHHFLASQLKDHTMSRTYVALVDGIIKENNGIINLPIGRSKNDRKKMAVNSENGKEAITKFNVLKRFQNHTLVECHLLTGRTHQIRVHMSYIGHPVNSDPLYGKKKLALHKNGQLLVAYKISFIHPKTKKEMSFEIPFPSYFNDIINSLN